MIDAALRELRERGYAHVPGVLPPDEAQRHHDAVGAIVDALVATHGLEMLHADEAVPVTEGVARTPTGLALSRLLFDHPPLRPLLLPDTLRQLADALFAEPHVEVNGCVVSDHRRPHFPWHTHIDGLDEGERQRSGVFPQPSTITRVFALLYLDGQRDGEGVLRVLPRALGAPTQNPAPLDAVDWEGQVEPRPRAGDLILLDQCTYHSVLARQTEGYRIFAGTFLADASATPAPFADPDFRGAWDVEALHCRA